MSITMLKKVKLLIQRRTSLKSQITSLTIAFDQGKLGKTALKLRCARLAELYREFETYNDELMALDARDEHFSEFQTIQESFYSIAERIEDTVNPSVVSTPSTSRVNDESRRDSSTSHVKERRTKLPEISLPTFDGKYENWLSFKNAFRNVIDSRGDLSDIDKLQYLKSALVGEASSKARIFSVDGINYANAWEVLTRAYEVKRLIIARHLLAIINFPVLEKETSKGLQKLADDVQQHIASLKTLGVTVGSEMVVQIMESKLPKSAIERWEIILERDDFPSLDLLYEFLYKSAVSASKRERSSQKSAVDDCEPPVKRKRPQTYNRTLLTASTPACIACKTKNHHLYACDKFKQLTVPKRIELVKRAKVCFNCMRSHRDKSCSFSGCTICRKRHNTLLHLDRHMRSREGAASGGVSVGTSTGTERTD